MLQLAVDADREAVNRLAGQVHTMHVHWRPDLYEMAAELYPSERFQEAIRERQLYVAKLGSLVVGYTTLFIRDCDGTGLTKRRVMRIEEFCVEERFRGQGIGMAMMEDVHALARAFQCTDLQLGVYPQNEQAVAFYQKCGFQIRSIDMHRKV